MIYYEIRLIQFNDDSNSINILIKKDFENAAFNDFWTIVTPLKRTL